MEQNVNYLLIGGGLASANAAAAIRERDNDGSILIIGMEPYFPYDRPPYSKNFLTDNEMSPDATFSKPEEFYGEHRIQLHTGVKATKIDRENRIVTLDSGDTIRYEKLLLATGARPNALGVPGEDLIGVFLLREAEDGIHIRQALRNSRKAVMIGAGFIGMEVAADCVVEGIDTTVLTHGDTIWSQLRPSPAIQEFLRSTYESKGVKFLFNEDVAAFEGEGSLRAVRTKSGKSVEADFCVVAVGVSLNSELAKEAGLEVNEKGAIRVSSTLQTSDPNIWAAGDVACFKDVALDKEWHVEHYMNAMWQGETVGANMAGEERPYDRVAYFFSDEFDLHMIMRGDPDRAKSAKVIGEMQSGNFVELYADDTDSLRMGVAFNHDEEKLEPISDTLESLIRERRKVAQIDPSEFKL
ncbi:MAG: FAD-dependent oxidoreductase [Armatimonadetes bacterium]|nr:FAD-dependent oxidoreductase [Armatimonadota bacterium]